MSGATRIDGCFETWVKKNSVIGEELSKTFKYRRVFKTLENRLGSFSLGICAYDGEGNIDWAMDESGNQLPNVRHVFTLSADLSGLQRFLKVQKRSGDQDFWVVDFNVHVLFGGTALKARITWKEGVSISHFYPHVTDIWLGLPGNLARRPFQHSSELSLLGHVCFSIRRKWEARSNDCLPFFLSPLDTINAVKRLSRGGAGNVLR